MSSKLFVLGHVNGQLEAAFKKLAALHAKNNFTCAIATGNLFGSDEDASSSSSSADAQLTRLLAGEIVVPVSTYFTVGTRPLPPRIAARIERDEDICENLHFLGKRSVTKTSDGLRIVALGGRLDETSDAVGAADAAKDKDQDKDHQLLPVHSAEDEKALRGAHSADILLTAIWPRGITRGSQVALPAGLDQAAAIPSSDGLADLVAALRPRYVLTASPDGPDGSTFFYEREGFFHPERPGDDTDASAIAVTRFISLAAFGNASKAKAMYAFALSSEAALTAVPPAGCTPSPFLARRSKRAALEPEPYSRFAKNDGGGGGGRYGRKRARRDVQPPPGPDRCFFCLSNPNLPTHMVCSIGNDAYLATAKGPLPLATTFAAQGLACPGHMIMVPLSHAATLSAADMGGPDVAAGTYREMTRFRQSLQAMLAAQSGRRLGAVTWEISRARNIHVHWQLVPVAADLVVRGLVEAAFRVEAENLQLPKLEEVAAAGDEGKDEFEPIEGDYFRVWLWAEEAEPEKTEAETKDETAHRTVAKTLLMRLDENIRFDLQYGRKVLAKLTGLEARTVWQDSVQTEAEETADVEAFRQAFSKWDFTLEG